MMNIPLSRTEIVVAKHECIELVTRFFDHYDTRSYDQLYALMTPDGLWHRPDGPAHVGPELQKSLAKRKSSLAVLHILSNMMGAVSGTDRVIITGFMTIVRDEDGALSPPPAKISPPTAILSFTVTCHNIAGDWRIAEVVPNYLFK